METSSLKKRNAVGVAPVIEENEETVNENECVKCGCLKINGVFHCDTCERCVYKMDHHCPWTTNCVGYLNIKQFLLFLFYVFLLCFHAGLVIY